jgi:phosphomannomutase
MIMKASQDIFRAYDIRGVYGEELNASIGERVGLAFGNYLLKNSVKGTVSIGCDARVSSPELQQAVATGISRAGFDVDVIGMVPIPIANFVTWKANSTSNPYLAGVYITASHNPAEYNGIRFRHPDGTGYTEGNIEIKRIFFQDELIESEISGKINRLSTDEVLETYVNFVSDKVGSIEGMRIALDPGNGVGCVIIERLFQKFGAETYSINNEPDGNFPNRPSEPAPKNLGDLISIMEKGEYDVGIAFDGDADRCVFIDNRARAVSAEKIGIITSKSLIKPDSNKVLAGVPCSMILEDEIPKIGGELIWIRVGDVFVCEELKKHNAAIAMEISAHFFAPGLTEFIFDDPLIFSLKLVEHVSNSDLTLAHLSDEIPSYPYEELKFKCLDSIKFKVNEQLEKTFLDMGYKVETIDGVKIWLDGGWVLLRPSNTQPVIRMFVEAKDELRLDSIKDEFKDHFDKAVRAVS